MQEPHFSLVTADACFHNIGVRQAADDPINNLLAMRLRFDVIVGTALEINGSGISPDRLRCFAVRFQILLFQNIEDNFFKKRIVASSSIPGSVTAILEANVTLLTMCLYPFLNSPDARKPFCMLCETQIRKKVLTHQCDPLFPIEAILPQSPGHIDDFRSKLRVQSLFAIYVSTGS
ncbi:hypothetical protein [Ruegeria atlantica]|uniref:hypothetical protein n=1 Tax=Ruegeria atlantica TaxID=81569 RepID=UPI00147F53FB|nr:hypothetical protein [Ruegeria atlantica]